MEKIKTDICIIGGGSGGLSLAAGAVQMGARVVLIERGLMGGDCLNYGCVPSKSLIAAAHHAHHARESHLFGVNVGDVSVDMQAVRSHVDAVIAGIAPHDSVERFEQLGVQVIQAEGRFVSKSEVEAGDYSIKAKYFVVATGSRPALPPIGGLDNCPYHTNETIFTVNEQVKKLVVVGGGPIGCEIAQAYRRLGSEVSIVELANILPRDSVECSNLIKEILEEEGVIIYDRAQAKSVSYNEDTKMFTLKLAKDDGDDKVEGTHMLLAAGRTPNIDNIGLDKAGVKYDRRGIHVDERLRSSNKLIYAIGDVASGLQFTHVAGYHAGIVIRNMLFRLPAKATDYATPWVTFTDPEIASVGYNKSDAIKEFGESKVRELSFDFKDNDRARTEQKTRGFIKVLTNNKGRVLGCTIMGAHAGELILPWVMAVQKRDNISVMAQVIAPYPSLSEISKRVAGSYYTDSLFSEKTRKIVRFLLKLP